ncbi:M28 family peptidase [Daejeonella sp. H1SJ63]|uniref:M28 family peptidase n=1 Tax=Daejeonella sp. H1SJ63 TaxID=3034145 RepID=UPI0023EABC31|nr:M28 family peptidase [Daejeonella sp. H1SJ63]
MKKQSLWALLILGFSLPAIAQDPNAEKYAAQISLKQAKKHLNILASDKFEGRETGKHGAEMAAEYIATEFKKLKLQAPVNGSYFQEVPLIETKFEVSSFTANDKALTIGKDFLFSGNGDAKKISANEIVFIGYGIGADNYDDLKNINISGKVVLMINKGEPMSNGISAISKTSAASDWSTNRFKRLQYVMSKDPSLILAVSPDVTKALKSYSPSGGRLSIKKADLPVTAPRSGAIAQINITPEIADQFLKKSGKTYEALKSAIDNSGTPQSQTLPADVSINYGPVKKDVKSVNVLGYLEGTDLKDELVVFSAHYDHVGITENGGTDKINNGADDDGSGTTGVLTIAKAYAKAKKSGNGPRRSILFLLVTGEEKGLLGSEYYSLNPIFPLANTVTNLNIDMIGRTGEEYKNSADSVNYCYLIGSDKLSTDLHKISEHANATYTKMKIDYKYNDPKDPERIYYRSDHYNFAKHNIPIIFYFNGVHEDYHKPSDEVSKINFKLLAKRAQLVYYTGWDLLNRDKRPVVDVKNDMPASR